MENIDIICYKYKESIKMNWKIEELEERYKF